MAKIIEEIIVIKLSKLIKNSDNINHDLVHSDILNGLEAVVQELVGTDIIVEVDSKHGN